MFLKIDRHGLLQTCNACCIGNLDFLLGHHSFVVSNALRLPLGSLACRVLNICVDELINATKA